MDWGQSKSITNFEKHRFEVIDFISQFENELVKIWNKPKFVRKRMIDYTRQDYR